MDLEIRVHADHYRAHGADDLTAERKGLLQTVRQYRGVVAMGCAEDQFQKAVLLKL